jgi:hypothetical protein
MKPRQPPLKHVEREVPIPSRAARRPDAGKMRR